MFDWRVEDIDECKNNPHASDEICNNTLGSWHLVIVFVVMVIMVMTKKNGTGYKQKPLCHMVKWQ